MTWEEVCAHPSLKDLPFKIETNEWGQIVMSPTKIPLSFFQGRINNLLYELMKRGETLVECAVDTSKGKLKKSALCPDFPGKIKL